MLEGNFFRAGRIQGFRGGLDKIVTGAPEFADVVSVIALESPAFDHEGSIPARFTADGGKASPPLVWSGVPRTARALVLLAEDPDALPDVQGGLPAPQLLACNLPATCEALSEGYSSGAGSRFARPECASGQRCVFQIFALDRPLLMAVGCRPTREALVRGMRGRVRAKGALIGFR